MLYIVRSGRDLDFRQLMDVYEESNRQWAREHYPYLSESEQILRTEQDMYENLRCFFLERASFYAIWEQDGSYVSAVRFEPYRDGMLLEALETKPAERKRGYAKQLVTAVLDQMHGKIYSHVDKHNHPSLAVHKDCGFEIILDHAVFIDGSASQKSYTLYRCLQKIPQG